MSQDCIFCKIVAGEIPAAKVYEDESVLAFNDINPVAPVHVLVIPKRHLGSANDLGPSDAALMGQLFSAVQQVAREKNVLTTGYRVLTNVGKDAGQVVDHLHFHVIGGKPLGRLG